MIFKCVFTLIFVGLFTSMSLYANQRSVDLAWGPVEGALEYELKIKSVTRKDSKNLFFKTKSAKWSGKIKPGEYEMNIRTYDRRGVPGPWSDKVNFWAKVPSPVFIEPQEGAMIESPTEGGHEVQFSWNNIYAVKNFKLIVSSPDVAYEQVIDTADTKVSVHLPVGLEFECRVQAVHGDGSLGDLADEPTKFTILAPALANPKLLPEKSNFMRILTWEPVPEAQAYKVRLLKARKNGWNVIINDQDREVTEVEMPLDHPPGKYKLEVQATAKGRKPSSISEEEFILKGGFR
jgi:hypothetical protein